MYIWQAPNWPHFVYQSSAIKPKLENVLTKQQQLLGKTQNLPEDLDRQAEMDALIQNALQTSEIEGEKLIHSQTILNERQVKVLNRLLDSTGEEFNQGINAGKYQNLTKISKATATRDLTELVAKGCLKQLPGGGRSTRYAINVGGL